MHRPARRAIRAAAWLVVVALVGACAGSGPSSEPAEVIATFTLTSPAFNEGAAIPRPHTCDGADTSPPLSWAGAPAEAKALALVMDDPDAGGFVHWVLYNLGPSVGGSLPPDITAAWQIAPQGRNSFGRIGYGGPCPPSGVHRYVFRLLALDALLPLTGTPRAGEILQAADGHALAEARLTGTYRRGS